MRGVVVVLWAALAVVGRAQPTSKYFLGNPGESCTQVCLRNAMNCNPAIQTGNSTSLFESLGVTCIADARPWWASDQPAYISNTSDPNYGRCLGWSGTPSGVLCSGSFPSSERLCRCDAPSSALRTFGTGLSNGAITTQEQFIFSWVLAPGDVGVMTHFWITYTTATDPGTIIRYYIDGETEASIQFTPSLAAGVGFYDSQGPWGTKWFGKGAADGAWFLNFRIPFQKTVLVTAQHQNSNQNFYMIVRGATNLPLSFGGVTVPQTARLNQFVVSGTYQPLDWVTMANVSAGTSGALFMHSLSVQSGNLNFLEACYHMYTAGQEFPGTLLSTGTEDYYDSAWYFNAGEFHFPVSGFTHLNTSNGVTFSSYRFHEMDPLMFSDGFQFMWRIGDAVDASGIKCMISDNNGRPAGSPTVSTVSAYTWVYTWQDN